MDLYRLVLSSKDKIHGVRLRELIQEIADGSIPKVYGQVKNLEDEHQVEIICQANSDSELSNFVDLIKKRAKESIRVEIENQLPTKSTDGNNLFNFNDSFNVIRGDSLKEIDLAIRGAEKVFKMLGTDILHFMAERRSLKLEGVRYILTTIKGKIKPEDPATKLKHINRDQLNEFIGEPFDADLFTTVKEIDQLLDELTEYEQKKVSEIPTDKITQMSELIDKALERIKALQQQSTGKSNIN